MKSQLVISSQEEGVFMEISILQAVIFLAAFLTVVRNGYWLYKKLWPCDLGDH